MKRPTKWDLIQPLQLISMRFYSSLKLKSALKLGSHWSYRRTYFCHRLGLRSDCLFSYSQGMTHSNFARRQLVGISSCCCFSRNRLLTLRARPRKIEWTRVFGILSKTVSYKKFIPSERYRNDTWWKKIVHREWDRNMRPEERHV